MRKYKESMENKTQNNWELEFEKEIGGGLSPNPAFKEQVKQFIRKLLSSQLEEIEKEIDKIDDNWIARYEYFDSAPEVIKEIKEAIKKGR